MKLINGAHDVGQPEETPARSEEPREAPGAGPTANGPVRVCVPHGKWAKSFRGPKGREKCICFE